MIKLEKYKWLFVVQTCELKSYEHSAAKLEVIEPIKKSSYVKDLRVKCFEQGYEEHYANILQTNLYKASLQIKELPVVIYGAGIHTQQHLSLFRRFNVVAIADKNPSLWGEYINEILIISPDEINRYAQHVILSSKAFENEIHRDLNKSYPNLIAHKLYTNLDDHRGDHLKMYEELKAEIEVFKPDIVFYSPTHPKDCLPSSYWLKLKEIAGENTKFVTIWWDYEENSGSAYLNLEKETLLWSNLCVENSNATRLLKMKDKIPPYNKHTNVDNVFFHPTVFDPTFFHESQSRKKKYPIALFGSAAGNRKYWIDKLKAEYPNDFFHIGGVAYGQEIMPISDYAEALRETKLCINTQTYPFREQCKGKVREALACGVVLLEEENKQTRFFTDNKNIEECGVAYFDSWDTLKALINQLSNQNTYQRALAGAKKFSSENLSVEKWTETLVHKLFDKN